MCNICYAIPHVESQQQAKKEINRLKWLENVENNKLYKNQQKLENAQNNLSVTRTQVESTKKELSSLSAQLSRASSEYNSLNNVLAQHIRGAYKSQRNARFQILLNSEDINMLVDRWYFQKMILKKDEEKMLAAKNKAREIAMIKMSIESRKRHLERAVASNQTQEDYIKRAIARNQSMINKLQTDRIAYEKAERDLARQSQSISTYINKASNKDSNAQYQVSGFMKPIQGRITSPYGWRTHPIFNTRTFHSGVDIGGPNLGAIRASNGGKVIYSGWYGGYGKVVILEHGIVNGKPITTLYAHMSTIKVANGQKVAKGDVLGYEGTTGYSTGPHCHFEVRINGQTSNPLNYI